LVNEERSAISPTIIIPFESNFLESNDENPFFPNNSLGNNKEVKLGRFLEGLKNGPGLNKNKLGEIRFFD